MPLKCTFRPNRSFPRRFTERDAARIICEAIRNGGTFQAIETLYEQQCGEERTRRPKGEAERALEIAAEALQQNNVLLAEASGTYRALEIFFRAVFQLATFVPPLRVLRAPARLVQKGARVLNRQTQVRQAANDRVFDIVSRAAANEERYRLTGTR